MKRGGCSEHRSVISRGADSGDNYESMGWILENTVMLRTFYKSH
jgi:hypothetical protein